MSDAEFKDRYDPPSRQERLTCDLLTATKDLVTQLADQPQKERPYQSFKPAGGKTPTGPVSL